MNSASRKLAPYLEKMPRRKKPLPRTFRYRTIETPLRYVRHMSMIKHESTATCLRSANDRLNSPSKAANDEWLPTAYSVGKLPIWRTANFR